MKFHCTLLSLQSNYSHSSIQLHTFNSSQLKKLGEKQQDATLRFSFSAIPLRLVDITNFVCNIMELSLGPKLHNYQLHAYIDRDVKITTH